ncbi:hypothetical protein [Natrononativus amylolyticus]|uniref:hypothetical protein n=1 Tax=Natrononativus amylolyticus TaxID=2963434 RepID=UPI0020CF6BC7|nr:hypothetical protein [Natrononativus amylolyticus]
MNDNRRPVPPEVPFEDALESLLAAARSDGIDVAGAWDVETRDGEYTVEIWPIDRE